MREVLFRAKGKDDGEWVYGWYCRYPFGKWPLKDAIIPSKEAERGYHHFVEVDHDTVGQYTGLIDKNGKRIFEGDIVSTLSGKTFEVEFADGSFYLYGTSITIHHAKRMLVVGNRWDTPELLEVTE